MGQHDAASHIGTGFSTGCPILGLCVWLQRKHKKQAISEDTARPLHEGGGLGPHFPRGLPRRSQDAHLLQCTQVVVRDPHRGDLVVLQVE